MSADPAQRLRELAEFLRRGETHRGMQTIPAPVLLCWCANCEGTRIRDVLGRCETCLSEQMMPVTIWKFSRSSSTSSSASCTS